MIQELQNSVAFGTKSALIGRMLDHIFNAGSFAFLYYQI
jgi:DNA repair photolyase